MEWWRKLMGWLRRSGIDAELQEEMRTHLEMKTAAGLDARAARRQFGNATLLLEDSRAAWGWPRLESWIRNFRYGVRMMFRRPGFSAMVVLTLALGIGASSTIFSLIDAVLIRPLAYPDSSRLAIVEVERPSDARRKMRISPGGLEDWQRLNHSFEAMAGSYTDTLTETTGTAPERISAASVSPRFFAVLGVPAALGRTFSATEERFGGPSVVVIGHGLWQRRFGGDPGVLKRNLILDNRSYAIVGVMPPSFQYPYYATAEIWVPTQSRPEMMTFRDARFYECIARLKPGVREGQAAADLDAVQARLGEQYPKTDAGWRVVIEPLKDRLVGRVRQGLWLLFGSVSLLLLIACTNVACLLLGQLSGRASEIATRCALGAGRAAIAQQLLAEGLTYAVAGGLAGMAIAFAGVDLLRTQLTQLPRITELSVDLRVLAAVAAASALAAILFSLTPVMQAFRRDPAGALSRGGRGVAPGGRKLQGALVSAQFALATVLLIGAGLFVRSLVKLQEAPLGFRPDNVLTLRIGASFSEEAEATIQRHGRTFDALSALPGVTAVAMSSGIPGAGSTWPTEFQISGEPNPDGVKRFAMQRVMTAGYFQTVGIPILTGKTCTMNPGPGRMFSALVNRKFAEQYFSGRDPIGRTLTEAQLRMPMEIVGIVGDVREVSYRRETEPIIYACGFLRYWPDSDILIRTRDDAAGMANAVRAAIRGIEPNRAIYSVRPLADVLDATLSQDRFRTLLVSLFSTIALVLAAVGLYGVMAYAVAQRTREFGIRMAMGARPGQIVSGIVRSGAGLTGAGGIAGLALAALASRLTDKLLYGVRPLDALTYISAGAVLCGVALLACVIPGRRATSIDPAKALREQ